MICIPFRTVYLLWIWSNTDKLYSIFCKWSRGDNLKEDQNSGEGLNEDPKFTEAKLEEGPELLEAKLKQVPELAEAKPHEDAIGEPPESEQLVLLEAVPGKKPDLNQQEPVEEPNEAKLELYQEYGYVIVIVLSLWIDD